MDRRRWDGVQAMVACVALIPGLIGGVILRFGHTIGPALGIDSSGLTDGQVLAYFYILPFAPAFAVTLYLLGTSLRRDPPTICVVNRSDVDLTVVLDGVPDGHECRRFAVPANSTVHRAPSRKGGQLSIGTAATAYTADREPVVWVNEPLWVSQRWVIDHRGDKFFSELRST